MCLYHRYFVLIVSQPKYPHNYPHTVSPPPVDHNPHCHHSDRALISAYFAGYSQYCGTGFGVGVCVRLCCPRPLSCCRSQTPYRLISRFFLNLRSVFYYDQSTAASQTAVPTLSPIRTHPFWRRPRQLTTSFTFGPGAETSIYGDLATRNEREAESFDLDIGMESRIRRDEDKDDIRLDADVVTTYEK